MNEDFSLKRIALVTAVVLATLGVVLLMWQFNGIIALAVVSLAVAAMTRAPVEWLVRRRVPLGIARLLVYLFGFLIMIGMAWFVLPRVAAELQTLAQDVSAAYADFQSLWMAGSDMQQSLVRRLPSTSQLNDVLLGSTTGMAQVALGATVNAVDVITQSLLVIVISLYLSADQARFERLTLSLLSPAQRARARNAWREMEHGLGAYLRSEVAQCLLAWVVLSFGFWLMGVRYPFTRALFAALAWLLPLVGGAVAVIPVLLTGLFFNPILAVIATLYTFAIFAFLEFVVERRLYPRERYGSVLVLLITIIMVDALGIVGLITAPPVAAAIQIALTVWLRPAPAVPVVMQDLTLEVSLASLKARLAEAQTQLAQMGQPLPRTQNLLARLSDLLARAESEIC